MVDLSFNQTYYGENGESRPTIGVTLGYTQYSHLGASLALCMTYSLGWTAKVSNDKCFLIITSRVAVGDGDRRAK